MGVGRPTQAKRNVQLSTKKKKKKKKKEKRRLLKPFHAANILRKFSKHRNNCEIILQVPISSRRLQILLRRKKKLSISLLGKESQTTFCFRIYLITIEIPCKVNNDRLGMGSILPWQLD